MGKMWISGKLFGTVIATLVASSAAYAFTASNTVDASTAGQGSGTIAGYTATSVAFDIDDTDPTLLRKVTFTISPSTAATVKVKLSSAWHVCSNLLGTVTCPAAGTFSAETLSGATNLNVVAIQNTDGVG